ncbi:MAG: helix-turn-helix transcriptional regulator [Syntrophothermus sp.]|uniref:helix-turn-helix domain-containing protein n=1 Tax=Syntrophothermus sp. TaxID=2736299 RepID=UPI00257F83F5|nr:helix-turn-helix transcriptional regulator [Syntrophothermus sp.]NSW84683.1 helix-turn-helix transcriptional regulator [Syntrophothermus sp.]
MFYTGGKAIAVDLRQKRQAKGLTMAQLSEFLECNPKHVSNLELGYCGLTIPKAAKAAAVVGPITVEVEGVGRVVIALADQLRVDQVRKSTANYGLVAWA